MPQFEIDNSLSYFINLLDFCHENLPMKDLHQDDVENLLTWCKKGILTDLYHLIDKIKREIDQGIYFLSDEKITYDFIDKIKVLLEESDEEVFG